MRAWRLVSCVSFLAGLWLHSITLPQQAQAQVGPTCVSGCTIDFAVEVTPDGSVAPTRPINTSGYTALFFVENTGRLSNTFSLSCSGTGGVTCTSMSLSQVTLAPGANTKVFVGYAVGNAGTGRLQLEAEGGAFDTGYWTVPIGAPDGKPGVAFKNLNSTNRDRSLCLTAGAGESAAFQCGDLLVTHAMPGFTTIGRERALTLVYNSAQAFVAPLIASTVTMRANVATPTSVYTELRVNGILRDSSTYSPWGTGSSSVARQIVLSYRAYINSTSDSSGVYPFTYLVRSVYPTSIQDSVLSGQVIVVNRAKSRFGAGWWLSGMEQLYPNQPVGTANGHILWVGADASAKLYTKQADGVTWVGALGTFPDTIRLAAGVYTRYLRHGARVTFNNLGRHTATISRTGQQTTFGWSTNLDTLKTITLPPTGATGTSYTLTYASGVLDKITDPAARVLDATITSGDLLSLKDPDNKTTSFVYNSFQNLAHLMASRTNRRGLRTFYDHNQNRLIQARIPVDSPATTWATTVFTPWDHAGITSGSHSVPETADDTAQAFTKIQGPRPSVPDDASFWVDQWGAPIRIVTPGPATTLLTRGDMNVPGLVTLVVYPNGRRGEMTYNSRGNLTKVREVTSSLDGRPDQVTSYVYPTSGAQRDSPIQVSDSIGTQARTTSYKYNATGLTDTVITPNGHRTSFAYKTGTMAGLLDSIMERGVETWRETVSDDITDTALDQVHRFTYDTKGNLKTYNSPTGVVTSYVTDASGRVTNVYDPLKTREERIYDPMNLVQEIRRYTSPLAHPGSVDPLGTHAAQGRPCDPTQVLCVDSTVGFNPALLPNPQVTRYTFNAMGQVASVTDPRGMSRSFSYEGRGLPRAATDDYGQSQTASFNAAGLPDYAVSRRGIRVNSYYDDSGRLKSLAYPQVPSPDPSFAPATTPGDSIRYTYDIMGNVTKVRSNADSVVRQYYADGSLKRKISSVVSGTQADTISYAYDATDALTRVVHGRDTTDYAYHATTGALLTMTVRWGGRTDGPRVFSFLWDQLGRRRQITYPTDPSGANNMTVKLRYDGAGVLRRVTSDHPGAPGGNALLDAFDFKFRNKTVDAAGRVWRQEATCGGSQALVNACGAGVGFKEDRNQYNRFGMLVRQQTVGSSPEVMRYDGSGNMIYRERFDGAAASNRKDSFIIDSSATGVHNQLKRMTEATNIETPLNILYHPDGSRRWEKPDVLLDYRETYYYYDGLSRMTGSVERDDEQINTLHHNPGTCVYDPEGQLVVACDGTGAYLSFDGQNVSGVLYNPQGSGWRFVHGPNTDDPLTGFHRLSGTDRILYYVTDGQGRVLALADSSGFRSSEYDNNSSIARWRLAGGTTDGHSFNADRMGGGDVPKLSFYRNRAYDQTTGRWTQEDPIGLAGGLNLYQFNGNNPVMYTDPFGLCPENNHVCPLIEFTTTVLGGIGGFIAGGGTGTAIALATGGAGLAAIPSLAVEGAAGGAVGGLGLGKAITNVMFSQGESKQIGDAITKAAGKKANTSSNRRDVGRFLEEEKAAGRGGTKNKRGDFTFGELVDKVKDFLGGE